MKFFIWKKTLYPVIALVAALFIAVFCLITARELNCSYFIMGAFLWAALFGCYRGCMRIFVPFIVVGGIFFGIFYAVTQSWLSALSMVNRLGGLFICAAIGMSISTVRMTRSLSQVHTPRAITLGMLISMSFVPMLKGEIGRVREAMKTRGAGSVLNPKILYRAFLVPFVMRLVNISDTLALSVETRGFTLGGSLYSIYKKEYPALSDVLFVFGIVAGAVLVVVL